jgi:hypothetical protein
VAAILKTWNVPSGEPKESVNDEHAVNQSESEVPRCGF